MYLWGLTPCMGEIRACGVPQALILYYTLSRTDFLEFYLADNSEALRGQFPLGPSLRGNWYTNGIVLKRKGSDKRISFLCQWQIYQYGAQRPRQYLPLWALLFSRFLYNSDIVPIGGSL